MARVMPWAMALALAAGSAVAQEAQTDQRPPVLREVGFDQKLGAQVPKDATFRDETGRTVKLGDYFGKKPVVLSFAYYECPMLCTLTLNGMVSALSILALEPSTDFEVVTISFEPKETPALAAAKKKTYVARYKRPGAAEGWHFLTGEASEIQKVTKAAGFRYVWDEATQQYAHASGIMVATPDGRLARYLYGVEYSPKDLRLALVEASGGTVGTPVDQLVLYCYHYDPVTGKYGPVVMAFVRVAGVLTMCALFGFIGLMRLRERATSAAARAVPAGPQPEPR